MLLTLQAAARKLEPRRLPEVTIFTTHEPCAMCVGALLEAEVFALVYAVPDDRAWRGGQGRPAGPRHTACRTRSR